MCKLLTYLVLLPCLAFLWQGAVAAGEDPVDEEPPGQEPEQEQPEDNGDAADKPEPPHPGKTFRFDRLIFDQTGLLTAEDLDRIQLKAERFERETGYPIVVAILRRLSDAGTVSDDAIGTARLLLGQFTRRMVDEKGRHGWLILISVQDGHIRIQKAEGWDEDVTASVQGIIDKVMIPLLSSKDSDGVPKKSDIPGAVLAGISELLSVVYRYRVSNQPVVSDSIDRFAAASWLWILLGLHFLGFIYVLCTKESEGWYVAGLLFGLPILFAMLVFVLQGEEDRAVGDASDRVSVLGGGGGPGEGNRAMVWGYW